LETIALTMKGVCSLLDFLSFPHFLSILVPFPPSVLFSKAFRQAQIIWGTSTGHSPGDTDGKRCEDSIVESVAPRPPFLIVGWAGL